MTNNKRIRQLTMSDFHVTSTNETNPLSPAVVSGIGTYCGREMTQNVANNPPKAKTGERETLKTMFQRKRI